MNFEEARAAVEADPDVYAIRKGSIPTPAIRHKVDVGALWESRDLHASDWILLRIIPTYTVESVEGKEFTYHEAMELKRQLGDAVKCTWFTYRNVPSPADPVCLYREAYYKFYRAKVTRFEATVPTVNGKQLWVELPEGAKPGPGTWKITAERVGE
jgi:hypothetical protein